MLTPRSDPTRGVRPRIAKPCRARRVRGATRPRRWAGFRPPYLLSPRVFAGIGDRKIRNAANCDVASAAVGRVVPWLP